MVDDKTSADEKESGVSADEKEGSASLGASVLAEKAELRTETKGKGEKVVCILTVGGR
jgi:hypothetical protein